MPPIPLFNKYDFYVIVTDKQDRLKRDYERLSDEDAVNDEVLLGLKRGYRMDVPFLKTDEMTYEDHELERPVRGPYGQSITKGFLIHIPFDGDGGVFQIKPNATDGTVVVGNVTGNELVLTVVPPTDDYDLDAHMKRELAKVDFRLFHLRASTEYVDQQLDITISQCVAKRRKAIETRTSMVLKLGIPKRQPASPPVGAPERQTQHLPEPLPPRKERQFAETTGQWDIFMSHASPDKPYVEPLVTELTKAGVYVWYDKHVLAWGDPLRSGINHGLINCRYAIVVLSKAFLAERKWTEHELSGLFAREDLGALIILPIWHGITREEILKYDPALADRLAKISNTDSYQDIVQSVREKLGRTEAMGTAIPGRVSGQLPKSLFPTRKPKSPHSSTPPQEPILFPIGLGSLMLGSARIQTIAIENKQLATQNSAVDAEVRIAFKHAGLQNSVVMNPGIWLPRESEPHRVPSTLTDIANECRANVAYLTQDEANKHSFIWWHQNSIAIGAAPEVGNWRAVVSLTARNCKCVRFGIAFRITAERRLADQQLLYEQVNFSDWLNFRNAEREIDHLQDLTLSLAAEQLLYDLATGCRLYAGSNDRPAIVMPRPGNSQPRTAGQVDMAVVEELLEKGVVRTLSGDDMLSEKGIAYYDNFLKFPV